MSEKIYSQRNKDVILNRAEDYYENDRERLTAQARDKYRKSSEEEKNEKRKYVKNRYHMSEEKKQRLKEYRKITVWLKSLNLINKIVLIYAD